MNIECPRCDGKGIVKKITKKIKKDELPYHLDICEFCHGDGEVDWVQRVVGKGSLTWEQKYDIWRNMWKKEKWIPKKVKKK